MSDVSRRTFLRTATLVATVAALPVLALEPSAVAAPGRRPGRIPLGTAHPTLTRSAFTPHLHATFRLSGATGTYDATLVEISDLAGASVPGDELRFSLLFRVPRQATARHGVHRVHRPGFGALDLFIGPVDRGVRARCYEAVVNHHA